MIEVTCPLCKAPIPLAHTDRPNAQGLTVGLDERLVDEHIEMHRNCTCYWANGHITFIDADCPIHWQPLPEADEPDGLFTDVLTVEDQ